MTMPEKELWDFHGRIICRRHLEKMLEDFLSGYEPEEYDAETAFDHFVDVGGFVPIEDGLCDECIAEDGN